jgi:LCP family protein required for cell wall assembly
VALLAVVGVAGYLLYDRTFGAVKATVTKDVRERPKGDAPPPPLLQQPFNVLLIGVDLREAKPEDGARSDTLIVAHVDPIGKWASMLSIPRDSYVQIPKLTESPGDRINRAYSYGYSNPNIYGENTTREAAGAALAAETVEQFLDVKIDYTAQIDFRGFEKLVDAVGGITIDVPHAILDAEYPTEDEGYMRLMIEPGLQRMDGVTALRYARTRHADNDFGRSQRQQQVIQTALSEIKRRGILGKLEAAPQLLSALRESVKTTMPIDDVSTLRGLAALAQEMGTDRIQRFAINPNTVKLDERFNDPYKIHWEIASVRELAQKFEQGPEQAQAAATGTAAAGPETATIQVQNGKGIKGLAGSVTIDLRMAGYTVNDAADAPKGEHPHTLILDYSNKPQTREKLAKFFKVDPQYVKDESANKDNAPFGVDIVVLLGQDYDPAAQAQGVAPAQ